MTVQRIVGGGLLTGNCTLYWIRRSYVPRLVSGPSEGSIHARTNSVTQRCIARVNQHVTWCEGEKSFSEIVIEL